MDDKRPGAKEGALSRVGRLVGGTFAAALAGAPLGAAGLVASGTFGAGEFLILAFVGIPIYFVVTLALGWPLVWLLRRLGVLSVPWLAGLGALVGIAGGIFFSSMGESASIPLVGIAGLSGVVS